MSAADATGVPFSPSLEFWFDFGSNYAYLSAMRIEQAAVQAGVRISWKPFLLGPIFRSLGWENSPFVLQKAKGDYVWKDMAREARKIGVPWRRPSVFPRNAVLPLRVAFWASDQEWIGAFCRAIMARNFVQDRDIDTPDAVSEVLRGLGLDAQTVLDAAQSHANKLKLREQTEAAKTKGIFGAPTFFVGEEMFWGNDRLDDALAECRLCSAQTATWRD